MIETNKIYLGDSLTVLKSWPDEFVDCVITSPPYWALRDYGVAGQLGLEPTFQEYITKLCDIFNEIKRVLKKDGTCWVNIGDTYGTGSGAGERNGLQRTNRGTQNFEEWKKNGKKSVSKFKKCLLQIPSRFAIEMSNRGWILRNRLIWHKPNCMPSSVTDRFTVDYEDVFFFVKSKKYYFEQQFEPYVENTDMAYRGKIRAGRKYGVKRPYEDNQPLSHSKTPATVNPEGKNKRSVWTINTKPFKEAHFATFPEKLVEPMVKAGCPKNGIVLDPFSGAGTTVLVARNLGRQYLGIELNQSYIDIANKRLAQQILI
jgi:site-specific DNA-methyltransferase (adenine-specific)